MPGKGCKIYCVLGENCLAHISISSLVHHFWVVLSLPLAIVMVSKHNYLQVLIAFAVLFQFMLDNIPTTHDVIHKLVMLLIEEQDLPPLTGKHSHKNVESQSSNIPHKRSQIRCNYARAEASIISDWVGEVPRFPDMQFKCTFLIKRHMVDKILNHLARRSSFWTKSVLCW